MLYGRDEEVKAIFIMLHADVRSNERNEASMVYTKDKEALISNSSKNCSTSLRCRASFHLV